MIATTRWLWSHRVPLVPLWVVLGVATATVLARTVLAQLPTWQLGGLVLFMLSPVALYARRITAPWRRRWVLLLVLAATALPTWGHWSHITSAGQGLALVIAHLCLGVLVLLGNLLNVSLGERVTMEGELRDWSETAKRIGYSETNWINTKLLPGGGWSARLTWPAGAHDRDQVRKDVGKFEGARNLPVGSLRLLPVGRHPNVLDAIYIPEKQGAGVIEWPGPARSEGYSATHAVGLGEHEDGSTVEIVRFREGKGERRILVGGASESGKSGVINNLVGEDACRDDVVGLGMDLKGGVELGPWEKVLLWMIHDAAGAIEMLAALEAGAVYRLGLMKSMRVRVWPVSPELPAVHVTVDEIRKLAGSQSGRTGKEQRQLLDRLIDVATQGRAVGFGLVAAGQRLTLEALGTSQISSQFDIRIGLRMNEKDSSNYVFPDDDVKLHKIPGELPGTAYLKDGDKLDPLPHRGYFWSDELVAEVASLREGGGAMLDEGTGDAMAAASPLFAEIWARVRGGDGAFLLGDERGIPAGNVGDGIGDGGESAGGDAGTTPGIEAPFDPATAPVPETFAAGDVSLADVVARNAERTRVPGVPDAVVMRPKKPEKLSEDRAKVAMRELLRRSGSQGCSARDLYTAATRSSSWFHAVINEWIDDEGSVVRSGHGRYVDARQLASAGAAPSSDAR